MFKVKSNDEIGGYLEKIIDDKYVSKRKFCMDVLREKDDELSDENIP